MKYKTKVGLMDRIADSRYLTYFINPLTVLIFCIVFWISVVMLVK